MKDPTRAALCLRPSAPLLLGLLLALAPTSAGAANGNCGQPQSDTAGPLASDALYVLKDAVGPKVCALCICDVTDDAKISASDALKILKKAVGQLVTLTCPVCQPPLTGYVGIPNLPVLGNAARSGGGNGALDGLNAASGVTVQVFKLNADGTAVLPAIATTTTNADGSYQFNPGPTPGLRTIVQASIGNSVLRAFVTGDSASVQPESEFLVRAALAGAAEHPVPGLDALTLDEILALDLLVTEDVRYNFQSTATIDDAVALVNERSGGVYAALIADFASSGGPTIPLAGSFNMVTMGGEVEHDFQPGSLGVPSVNERSVKAGVTSRPIVIAAGNALSSGNLAGRAQTLSEISGSTPQQSGPDLVTNATVSLVGEALADSPKSGDLLLATKNGALLLNSDGVAAAGAFAAGSNVAVVPVVSSTAYFATADASVSLVLRKGQGLSNADLSGTWSATQFEVDFDLTVGPGFVQRGVGGRTVSGAMTFDGNGHMGLAPATGVSVLLDKTGIPPDQFGAETSVALTYENAGEDAVNGLDYTLTPTGELTVKQGANVVAVGAVSPDLGVVVLRIHDETPGYPSVGYLVAVKHGSGMDKTSGLGTYRTVDFAIQLHHNQDPGLPDVEPSSNHRSVGFRAELGSFDFDGAGGVTIDPSVSRGVYLDETSGVLAHAMAPGDIFDASVSTGGFLEPGSGSSTHIYTVDDDGTVILDGVTEGYLSADGNVFVLPQTDRGTNDMNAGMLIGLREP